MKFGTVHIILFVTDCISMIKALSLGRSIVGTAYGFAGNPLDRSSGDKYDETMLTDILGSDKSIFYLVYKNQIACTSTTNISTVNTKNKIYNLIEFNKDVVNDVLQIDSNKIILGIVDFVVLGQNYRNNNYTWSVAIDLVDEHQLKRVSSLKSSGFDACMVDARTLLLSQSSNQDIAIAGQAISLLTWHRQNKFSGITGKPTRLINWGSKRECIESKTKLYPRNDPVGIACVISPDGTKCLLGRNKRFPKGFYSCLSGFIEPGESVQEAIRREVKEESGVVVGEVFLIESQPWPIGRNGGCELMLGCIAIAIDETITINYEEMEDVRWFSIDEAKEFINYHKFRKNEHIDMKVVTSIDDEEKPSIFIPGPYAIAFHLIDQYVKLYEDLEHNSSSLFSTTAVVTEPSPHCSKSNQFNLSKNSSSNIISRILNTKLFSFLSGTLVGSILTVMFLLKIGSIRKIY